MTIKGNTLKTVFWRWLLAVELQRKNIARGKPAIRSGQCHSLAASWRNATRFWPFSGRGSWESPGDSGSPLGLLRLVPGQGKRKVSRLAAFFLLPSSNSQLLPRGKVGRTAAAPPCPAAGPGGSLVPSSFASASIVPSIFASGQAYLLISILSWLLLLFLFPRKRD